MATPLPLNGAPLVLNLPEGEGQPTLTLQGRIEDAYDGSIYDGHDADEGGSLLQISPGQWTLLEADAAAHTYTYGPVGEVTGLTQVSVQFDAPQLIDAHLISPREVQANLTSTLEVSADVPPPPALIAPMTALGVAVALAGVAYLLYQGRGLWNKDRELRGLWARCAAGAKQLKTIIEVEEGLSDSAREGLLSNLTALMAEAKALRSRIPIAENMLAFYRGKTPKNDALLEEIRLLREDIKGCWDGLTAIANTLEAQALALTRAKGANSGAEEVQAVQDRLEALKMETAAALDAKAELETIDRVSRARNRVKQ